MLVKFTYLLVSCVDITIHDSICYVRALHNAFMGDERGWHFLPALYDGSTA